MVVPGARNRKVRLAKKSDARRDACLPAHPSCIVVSFSGGKDSLQALQTALREFGQERVVVSHQWILEDWPGTIAYCQMICDRLGVPLSVCRGEYSAMICGACGHRHITNNPDVAYCHTCMDKDQQKISHQLFGIHDMISWRGMFPDL